MAENSLAQLTCPINNSDDLISCTLNGQPAILSTEIAEHFQKRHHHILRDIDKLRSILPKSFHETNFGFMFIETHTGNGGIRRDKAYRLTRDAFSLLVMGMTGKTAIMWKLRYIEAFNALEKAQMQRERAALENAAELAREAGYLEGRQETLALPVMQAERKAGYLDGLKEGKRLAAKNDKLDVLVKIRSYVEKGLSYREIGKILDLNESNISRRISRAKKLGFWPQNPAPCQGSLMEAAS